MKRNVLKITQYSRLHNICSFIYQYSELLKTEMLYHNGRNMDQSCLRTSMSDHDIESYRRADSVIQEDNLIALMAFHRTHRPMSGKPL